jgi:Uncharacterized protein conserved in bacteria (DUF2330)
MRPSLLAALAALLGGLAVLSTNKAGACGIAEPPDTKVALATETALIVWDEKTKTQHFIRRASFKTATPYFGFLVPTPTRPKLAEAPDELFTKLEAWTEPRVRHSYYVHIPIGCGDGDKGKRAAGVEVLERQRVGGFDAAVLRATDGKALQEWLDKHGYDSRPALIDWLKPYIKAGWIITAFQIAKKDRQEESVSTQAVRMSFQADRPFFPYREPDDQGRQREAGPRGTDHPGPDRLLRVYVIAAERREGRFDGSGAWGGQAVHAAPLAREQADELTRLIASPDVKVAEGAWLTEMEDRAHYRDATTDLFFAPAADRSELRRPEKVHWHAIDAGWVCLGVFGLMVGSVALMRWLGRRSRATPGPAGA